MLALSSAACAFTAPVVPAHSVGRAAVSMGLSWTTPSEGAVWDPIGLAKTPEKFERLRYVEIKHGRIAMLAVVGYSLQEYTTQLGVVDETPFFFTPITDMLSRWDLLQ